MYKFTVFFAAILVVLSCSYEDQAKQNQNLLALYTDLPTRAKGMRPFVLSLPIKASQPSSAKR